MHVQLSIHGRPTLMDVTQFIGRMLRWPICVFMFWLAEGTDTSSAANDYQYTPAVRSQSKKYDKSISDRAQLTMAKTNLQVQLQDTSNFIRKNHNIRREMRGFYTFDDNNDSISVVVGTT